ncbi:protein-L-isoaspartate(D-aspartate) O-methyltransferase [candidate division WOR-3 bacterium]|nr:protein-L-isoaspartate(D-aspartate) O-methyltransferase [candidate division WOR-3 bacterium]
MLLLFLLISNPVKDVYEPSRQRMVEEQIIARGVNDSLVIDAIIKVKRHLFVPKTLTSSAYEDHPLPIGYGQTISQPYIVALMTELLEVEKTHKVLEVGTGSGYQAAVLALLADSVFSIEIISELAHSAEKRLDSLGYNNVTVKAGDGYKGWKEHAPFDGIIVTCAPDEVPALLLEQLDTGGRMVIPVGSYYQELLLITKDSTGITEKSIVPVRFVPMIKGD